MLDTGMTREGVYEEAVREMVERARSRESIRIEGLYTHFATADLRLALRHRGFNNYQHSAAADLIITSTPTPRI